MIEPPPQWAPVPARAGAAERAYGRAGGLVVRLDVVLWVALVAAGAALRLARLDALPLTFEEAGRAFEALRVSQNSVPDGWNGDLAASLTSYLFRAFGEGEFVARVVPAVAGGGMVAAVWLGRQELGRSGALAAGALLAFSPLAVLFSRTGAPFSVGGLLAVTMVVSLLSYLREPRAQSAFLFAVAFGLAPSTDAVGTTAAITVVAFLFLDSMLMERGAVVRAWRVFRRSPSHWVSVALVLAAALELGLTHFGTSIDRVGVAGLTLWGDMFALPRDGREPEYQLALLLAYDWPILVAGGLAAAAFGWRVVRRGVSGLTPPQRFLLLWTALASLTVGLATQREGGQMLVLLPPLALLGGLLVEEMASTLDWSVLLRWWPAAAAALALLAYAALVTTEWSEGGASGGERASIVLALAGAALVLTVAYAFLGRNAATLAAAVAAVVAFAFVGHSSLSLVRNDEGAEFAVDTRTTPRIEQLREVVAEIGERRTAPVRVDPGLEEPLAWYMRDLDIVFAPPDSSVDAVVVPAGEELEGFTTVGEPRMLGEGWYPVEVEWLPLWRWLVFREPYDTLDNVRGVDVEIMVPVP